MDADGIEQATFRLPVGTVTFVLTDVEGSTWLWESAPEAMGAAVARHYELLDAAIALHGGVRPLEQGEGDSVVAAFARASDAVATALDVQRAFHSEGWPEGASLRLRMALHTAEAQLRDEGNYFGRAVNRCARSRTAARSCCPGAVSPSFEEAARLLGAAAAGREWLGIVRFPPEPEFWASVELTTREALGIDGYDAAFAALGTDEAVAYVRRARGERKRPSHGWDSLTPTELDVVRHIAAGRTNRPTCPTSSPSWAPRRAPTWPPKPPDADSTLPAQPKLLRGDLPRPPHRTTGGARTIRRSPLGTI